jgi:hypothetical protein
MGEYNDLLKAAKEASAADQIWRLQNCCLGIIAKIPDATPACSEEAVAFFRALRGQRRHEQLEMLGEAYIKAGYQAPKLWTIYAQALIERGSPVAARGVLSLLLANDSEEAKKELRETYGLCGRAWKDIGYEAIRAKRKDVATHALKESYKFYLRGFNLDLEDPELIAWYGSQRVALSHIAEKNDIAGLPDEKAFAKEAAEIVKEAIDLPKTSPQQRPWLMLGGAELCVAADDLPGAMQLCEQAVALPDHTDSFMFGSLYRQLSQIWRIGRESDAGAKLEALLMNAIVKRHGGVMLSDGSARQLQARLPGEQAGMGLTSIQEMLRCAKSVAMIRGSMQPLGTGFVVDAEKVGLPPVGKVVLTNAHIVSNPPQGNAVAPGQVQVQFGLEGGGLFKVKEIVGSLPVERHDCTALLLDREIPATIAALPVGDADIQQDRTACVIGHPLGQELTFSLLNAELVGCETPAPPRHQRLHYRSTTDAGSSGSPVFNASWDVIGIHCAYQPSAPFLPPEVKGGTHAVNEGISLASIREKFRKG